MMSKTAADLVKLPFTTKDELRSLYPYGILAVPREQVVEVHATSGTTGVPTLGFYTLNDIDVWGEVCARSVGDVWPGQSGDILQITPSFGMFHRRVWLLLRRKKGKGHDCSNRSGVQ
jgi:phenylacetate-CoA ligase